MTITINAERPDTPDASALIAELDAELEPLYARESRHGYSVDQLLAEGVAFFVLRSDGIPAACGGVKLVAGSYAEVKRMFVRPAFRGAGLSRVMLDHLIRFAREQRMPLVRLETGIHQTAAIALYESAGFRRVPPFGEYREDPVSFFYELVS
jgi:GNAT superfamily N-acetyltransferase